MRVLLIEDDQSVAKALHLGLRSFYAIDRAYTGKQALELLHDTDYDAILLDLNLPDIAGEVVCQKIRQSGNDTPIIVLTGRDLTEDKVALLDMGADDYITKPFKLEEVKARIRAAMRHGSKTVSSAVLCVEDLVLDPAGRSVKRGSTVIDLRRKEFDLLEYMMRHVGQALTRAMILEHAWEVHDNLWANVVDVHIKHLRDKIDRPFKSNMIRTVHGVGYKLEPREST